MHYPNLASLIADRKRSLSGGPIAIVLLEDSVEVESTLAHLKQSGFAKIIAFGDKDIETPDDVWRVVADVSGDTVLPDIINQVIAAAPNVWLHYCYNAEYLFHPFREQRTISELINFATEERRDNILTYVIDLYAGDLSKAPLGVDLEQAHLDRSGYYALSRKDDDGTTIERQMEFYGGLRWRFEEHMPYLRRRIDRMSLFRAVPGLELGADHLFNIAEYNTFACPWHNSPTAAVCSFRTAKALKRNPGSRYQIDSFHWQNSEKFNWQSQQLFDLD